MHNRSKNSWRSPLHRYLVVLWFVCLCSGGCTSDRETVPTSHEQQITFYDSDGFDRDLSASLRSKPETVRIKVLGTISVNEIPPRLGAWLNEVRKGGGRVAVLPDKDQPALEKSFSVLGGVIDGLLASISYIEQRNRYGPAQYYDASIYADSRSASITEVVFTAKEEVQ